MHVYNKRITLTSTSVLEGFAFCLVCTDWIRLPIFPFLFPSLSSLSIWLYYNIEAKTIKRAKAVVDESMLWKDREAAEAVTVLLRTAVCTLLMEGHMVEFTRYSAGTHTC